MIIISQNKEVIINFDNALGIQEEEKDVGVKFAGEDSLILGSYKTKKRAKEVLQEIVKAYTCIELINTQQLKIVKGEIYGKDLAKCICYEMPKE